MRLFISNYTYVWLSVVQYPFDQEPSEPSCESNAWKYYMINSA